MPQYIDAATIALVESFAGTSTSIISDCLERLPGTGELRPIHHLTAPMAGIAYTVKVPVGDNAAIHEALREIAEGQILVVDGGGDTSRALIGEIMTAMAEVRGVGGIVIDGAVRDSATIAKSSLPVFARGINHRGPFKNGPGERQVPVSIGGMVVRPGDIIVGDADGLVAFPTEGAEELLAACKKREDMEEQLLATIRRGETVNYK